ncbi:MAG: WecB/TagA/CpsF family glycosyltransferase [Fimbriimonadales bacterium]|nr:WecB/TagA/CpsF family glycosyltransferase [Fimbriimonadales bacterium]
MESALQEREAALQEARILGVRVHRVSMAEALQRIEQLIQRREPSLVITADANAILIALQDAEFHELMETAPLITADGAGLIWAGKRLGQPFPERVSGVDLVEQLTRLSHEKGYRLYFVGAAHGVAERAAQNLLAQYPQAQIVGAQHGYFQPTDEPAILAQIAAARPDVLLVGMGMPRQEKWAWRHRFAHGAPVMIGVGGSFDVYAGVVKRAPRWMQRTGCEWLWRLLQDPRKIKKVRNLPKFAWQVWRAPARRQESAHS